MPAGCLDKTMVQALNPCDSGPMFYRSKILLTEASQN